MTKYIWSPYIYLLNKYSSLYRFATTELWEIATLTKSKITNLTYQRYGASHNNHKNEPLKSLVLRHFMESFPQCCPSLSIGRVLTGHTTVTLPAIRKQLYGYIYMILWVDSHNMWFSWQIKSKDVCFWKPFDIFLEQIKSLRLYFCEQIKLSGICFCETHTM